MKWAWKLTRIAGIDVYVHATFLLIIGWVGISYWTSQRTLSAVFAGLLFILLLFAFVVMHEYGHALMARRYGIRTRDITLYPIGGVARLERMPDVPIQELWVALAGPAVNVVIAFVLFIWLQLTNAFVSLESLTVSSGSLLERLMIVNVWLVLFNLIPAFPMDGGRVLRALLALRLEYTRATQIAAQVGQAFAFLFGFIGLFSNPFLVFIALFVWVGAEQEASMVRMKHALSNIPVSRAMLTDFEALKPSMSLAEVTRLVLAGSQYDFPVVQDDQVVGVLNREDLLSALARLGENASVSSVMHMNLPQVDSHEMLDRALLRLQESRMRMLPVTYSGKLVGLLTKDNVTEFIMIRQSLKEARGSI